MKEKKINEERMLRHIDMGNVEDNTTILKEAKQQLAFTKDQQNKFQNNAEEYREADLLDYYDGETEVGDTPEIREK